MHGTVAASEYQGKLRDLSVNTGYDEVLATARHAEWLAQQEGSLVELAQARLALAEAHRRLGHNDEAAGAWKSSYRCARSVGETSTMAWALWSGGTLARQRGRLVEALRWLSWAQELAVRAGDREAHDFVFAGIAETNRIRGDFELARNQHEQILDITRRNPNPRHIVWVLEGLAQIDRNTGDLDAAWRRFDEACTTAESAGDQRGYAWALRGLADVASLRGEHEEALRWLSKAEDLCRSMDLSSALAYNRKMRGNVLYRAGRHREALRLYDEVWARFEEIGEPRGRALAELGSLKCRHQLHRSVTDTAHDLIQLRDSLGGDQLWHTRKMVQNALDDVSPAAQ